MTYLCDALRYPSDRQFSAALFDGNETFIGGLMAKKRLPSARTLIKIRKGTNISLDWIVMNIGQPDLGQAIFFSGKQIEDKTERTPRGSQRARKAK